jgi:glucose 1-dehydrogenase
VPDEFALHPEPARLLTGRRALVTGAGSGIGRGVALELAAHGAAVAINHRESKREQARELVEIIERGGGTAMAVEFDVTDEAGVQRGFAAARERLGGVDLLVNNAGLESPFKLWEMPLDEWQKVIDVNLTGAFLCAREAARMMIGAGDRGGIVNISSVHEQIPWRKFSHYCASKGGLKLWAQTIAYELAEYGIRVVNVAPGAIETPINQPVLDDPKARAEVEAEIPLGRWGRVEDVSRTVAWVASEQADYIVGATIFVDGGMTLYPNFV